MRRRKRDSAWITSNLWGCHSPNVWACKSCFLSPNWFFSVRAFRLLLFAGHNRARCSKRAAILGLGSKLCASNVLRMLNKDFTQFMLCPSRVLQNRASKRMALLERWTSYHTLFWIDSLWLAVLDKVCPPSLYWCCWKGALICSSAGAPRQAGIQGTIRVTRWKGDKPAANTITRLL